MIWLYDDEYDDVETFEDALNVLKEQRENHKRIEEDFKQKWKQELRKHKLDRFDI